jgi:hypothetical protein
MQEYPVMKKAEERALVKGIEPIFMFIGVVLLLLSIVALFAGGPSFVKFIVIVVIDTVAFLTMKVLSRDKTWKKNVKSKIFPLKVTIKGK